MREYGQVLRADGMEEYGGKRRGLCAGRCVEVLSARSSSLLLFVILFVGVVSWCGASQLDDPLDGGWCARAAAAADVASSALFGRVPCTSLSSSAHSQCVSCGVEGDRERKVWYTRNAALGGDCQAAFDPLSAVSLFSLASCCVRVSPTGCVLMMWLLLCTPLSARSCNHSISFVSSRDARLIYYCQSHSALVLSFTHCWSVRIGVHRTQRESR